jgi:gas vesicle protein
MQEKVSGAESNPRGLVRREKHGIASCSGPAGQTLALRRPAHLLVTSFRDRGWEKKMETLVGVVLGALIGFVGTYLNHCLQLRQERKKETRQAIANVASALGALYAVMESLSWQAEDSTHPVAEQTISAYGNKIETHLEHLFGVLPLVAVHDPQAYEALRTQAETAKEIDEKITEAIESPDDQYRKRPSLDCQKRLEGFYQKR